MIPSGRGPDHVYAGQRGYVGPMFAIAAIVTFLIAAIIALAHLAVPLTTVVGIIALGLAFLALHDLRPWAPWGVVRR